MNQQSLLLKVIQSDSKMLERYKKSFNRKNVTEAKGLCSFLCAHAARHNLLVDKNTLSKKFFDHYVPIKNKKLEESLIEDLMNEAEVDNQYFEDIRSQNSQATSKKLNRNEEKIKRA